MSLSYKPMMTSFYLAEVPAAQKFCLLKYCLVLVGQIHELLCIRLHVQGRG